MRYLEEIQRSKENRRMQAEKAKHMELLERRRQVKDEKEKLLAKVRLGAFRYHHGKLGFYDSIYDVEPAYIQYEDSNGYPYYLDPKTGKSQYELPNAPIIHHLEKERHDYDQLYGAGSYDALIAEQEWKEQCNRDGGYYDDKGEWVPLNGYYNEHHEFVSWY
jgi:hypothetical protein